MKTLLATFYLLLTTYELAAPGYSYQFPRDHFAHPSYRTEWWYYTGNLWSADGRRFGFELTFFRQGSANRQKVDGVAEAWQAPDVYLAHLALTDVAGKRFYHYERINRPGPGLAGCDVNAGRIWNGNWQVQWSDAKQSLSAVSDDFSLELNMTPAKPFVIHGERGLSRKSAAEGHGSHYLSYTRLNTTGTLRLSGQAIPLSGLAWRDHEFFTQQLDSTQAGWDWMSIQLADRREIMIYRLRKRDGAGDSFSSGTIVDEKGGTTHLDSKAFVLTPGRTWKSARTGAEYPVQWTLSIPSLELKLDVTTPAPAQELASSNGISPSYWEGLVDYRGRQAGRPLTGFGYLEMTGYDKRLVFGE